MKNSELANIDTKQAIDALSKQGITIEIIEKFYPRIFEPLGKPSQLQLSSREFFYWTDKGIIDIPKTADGQSPWSRLNLLEILWIRIVKELREFNLPFASIKILKTELFKSSLKLLRDNKEFTINIINKTYDDLAIRKMINDTLFPFEIESDQKIKKYEMYFSMITGIISEILLFKRTINLIVFKTKSSFRFSIEGFKTQDLFQDEIDEAKKSTHLIINLRNLVADYLLEPELEKLNTDFGFITEDEKELIKVIRNKQVQEINIKKDDNEVITYIATSKSEIKDDQVKMIKRLLRMNEYDDVRVVLRNDKHLYIENKKKIKIRPEESALKKKKN